MSDPVRRAAALLRQARKAVALTGAGASVESGLGAPLGGPGNPSAKGA